MLRDNWLKWFERRIQLGRISSRRRRSNKRLQVQSAWIAQELEARTLLTTYTVDNMIDESDGNTDPGDLSLREAIELANANPGMDDINFLSGAGGFGGAVLQLTLGDLTVTDDLSIVGFTNMITLNGGGLILDAGGPGETLIFSMTGVGINDNTNGPGLLLEATDDELVVANISNAIFNNSAEEGVKIVANTGGEVRLTLTDSTVGSNGDAVLSAGIGVDVGVSAPAESNTTPGKFSVAKLNMSDVDVLFNPLEGLDVNVATGGRFQTTTPMTNVLFQGNGGASTRDQVSIRADGAGTSVEARFDTVTANNAKKSAFNFEGTAGANLLIVLNNSSGTGAGSDAIGLLATGAGTTATVSVNNFVGDGAGLFGLDLDVMSGASVRFNNFNNISMQNSGRGGVDVDMIGGSIPQFSASNVNVSGGSINGLDLFLRQGTSFFTFNGLTSNNNVERGVQISSIVSAISNVTINNISAIGNLTKQAVNIVVNNLATLNLDVNGGTISTAGTDPNNSVFAQVKRNAVGNLSFDGLTVNNSTSSAFVTRYDFASSGNFEITNTTATGSQVSGMGLYVYGDSNVTGNFDGFNVSGSGVGSTSDAFRIEVNGHMTTASFALNNVNASNATRDAVSIKYFNRAMGAITKFDNINAQNAGFQGLMLEVRGMAKLTSFTGNGVNVSGAGQNAAMPHDGALLHVLTTGTTASINLQNLTANNTTSRGVSLLVHGGATADVVVDGFTANGNAFQGLNVAVGTISPGGRLLSSVFRNGSFDNNGTAGVIDGIRTRVTGTGAVADVTFDNVSADGNTRHGHFAFVDGGGDLTLGVDNGSTASNNFLNGFRFEADGPTTTAALTSTSGNNQFDGNNDNGLFVLLTNGVTVSDLTIRGGGSGNDENGGVIRADDLTGVTITNLLIGGPGANFNNNAETGLIVDLDGVLGLETFSLDAVTASGNLAGATGINATLANMTVGNIAVTGINAQNNNGDGLTLLLDAVMVTADVAVTGFNTGGNAGDGVDVSLINATAIAGTMSLDGTSGGNTGDGAKFTATDASGVSIGTFEVSGDDLNVNGNMGNGLTIDFDAVIGITSFDLSGMVITNNAGDQVFARFKDMPAPLAISFDDATATGPGGGSPTGDGIDLTVDNTTVSSLALNRINASSNGGTGLKLNLLNGASIPATSIDVGTFDNNGVHGIGINITSSTAEIDITNSTFDLLGTIASASGNGGNGLNVLLNDADLTMNTVDQIIFDGNGGTGITIQGATPSTFTSGGSFTNNTITNNGSFGFRGIFNGGVFDIAIGSRTDDSVGNLFDNNTGASILLEMLQNSVGRMGIFDNIITSTNDDNDPATPFAGAGIFVRMLGTANPAQATNTLTDDSIAPGLLIRGNSIGVTGAGTASGNEGSGINFEVEEESFIDGLEIRENLVNNNGIDGLNFRRLDAVVIDRFRVVDNTFNGNGDDGVEVIGQNDDATSMDLTLTDNEMNGNGDNGTALQVNADAKLTVDVQRNMMVGNTDDGLDMTEIALSVEDDRAILGDIGFNTISNNGNRGINAGAFMGIEGVTPTRVTIHDNTIGALLDEFGQVVAGFDGNGSTGINLTGGGVSTWTNNNIIRNGRLVTADRTVGHGIDISDDFFGFYVKDIILDSNLIRENFQDGIEFNNSGISQDPNFNFFFGTDFFLELIDNRIQDNIGRGIDILNQLLADSFITIRSSDPADPTKGNVINSNGEEGVYAVNTASSTQSQDAFASTLLAMDGSVIIADPTLSLVIDSSTVSNNGDPANVGNLVQSAGIVVRVGSAGESSVFGGFEFATAGFVPPAVVSAPVIPTFVNPGVFLQVTNNTMLGNFGDDAFLHGYTSTVDPGVITGAWSEMEFTPMIPADGNDPLARLDVFWGTAAAGNGNTFDSIEVNNTFGIGIPSTPKGQPGAYYDTAEGTFKSRLGNTMPPGPFSTNSANRRRNAQRAPARSYPGGFTLAPTVSPDGGSFRYPGLGDSTFRTFAGGDTAIAAELASIGFAFDDNPAGGDFAPIESPFEANGTSFSGTQGSFELPFGWGTYGTAPPVVTPGVWTPQGPFSATGGQVENISPGDEVVGALHTVIAHPTDADVLYVGGTNGGVWKTTNATAASPDWTPLTDGQPSQSIGAMAFDVGDATSNTVYAGIGRFSSFGRIGNDRIGLLRTTDGGAAWEVVDGGGTLVGKNISGAYANGSTIVVSVNTADSFTNANIGIFRSTDSGTTFTQVSGAAGTGLPEGVSYDLAADPTDPDTLYTSVAFSPTSTDNGVYKSTDQGATWAKVSDAVIDALIGAGTSNLEIAVGTSDNVYLAVINFGRAEGLFRSGDGGATWVQMDTPTTNEGGTDVGLNPGGGKGPGPGSTPEEIAGGQGAIHFSILADPGDANIVYVGGDRQPLEFQSPTSVGGTDFSGRLFRGDASAASGSQWVHLTHSDSLGAAGGGTASTSSPHADSREMVFDANGNLIEVDDGGVYRRTSPQDNTGDWFSIIGNLQVTEAHDVAWDAFSHVAITGNQDTGTTYQPFAGAARWASLSTADGGDVAVDDVTLAGSGMSIRYSSFQNLGSFRRTTWDASGLLVSTAFPARTVSSGAAFVGAFRTPVELNAINPLQLILQGSNSTYESLNQGDTIAEVGAGAGVSGINQNAIAYGGRKGGVDNADVLWVGSGSDVFFRSGPGALAETVADPTSQTIRDLAIDPDDWGSAFVIDQDQVFATFDEGDVWSDVTGNLLTFASSVYSIQFVAGSTVDALVVGTNRGVFVAATTALGTWVQLGGTLPNVPVYDMDFDPGDDVLVAGTLGRGAWTFFGVSDEIEDAFMPLVPPAPELAVA